MESIFVRTRSLFALAFRNDVRIFFAAGSVNLLGGLHQASPFCYGLLVWWPSGPPEDHTRRLPSIRRSPNQKAITEGPTPRGAGTPQSRHPSPPTPWSRHPRSPGSRPPQRPAARHAGIPPAMHAGIAPPC